MYFLTVDLYVKWINNNDEVVRQKNILIFFMLFIGALYIYIYIYIVV